MYTRVRKRPMSEINVVPYIDVMLVLLVIFMIAAPLLSQGVKVELPKADAQLIPPSETPPIVVNVDQQGALYINYGENQKKPINDVELAKRVQTLLKLKPETTFLIGGDADAAYHHVVRALTLLQQAGVQDFGMLTESPESAMPADK